MDVFGLTPIDSALAAWGLNCAQKLTAFLFTQTPVGIVGFAIGFLWSLWESVQENNFKHFVVFIFISLTGILLFITPQRQESSIKSAMEVYGTNSPSAQSLKNIQTNERHVPVLLSFVGQMADTVSIGAISVLDNALMNYPHFLNEPFGLQKLSLQANRIVHSPISDVHLKEDLDDFIYAHYLPSLNIYSNDPQHHVSDLHSLWPGDAGIISNYSSSGNEQWNDLKKRLTHLIGGSQAPWQQIKDVLAQMNAQDNNLDNHIIASMIQGQLYHADSSYDFWWRWAGWVQALFPYMYGWGSFCLYVAFPVLMLALVVVRRMSLFLRYAEMFLWIKSWALTSAISYYISLMVARLQAQASSGANWFWDYPYYTVVASILLCLMPILTLTGIHHSFQVINNRS